MAEPQTSESTDGTSSIELLGPTGVGAPGSTVSSGSVSSGGLPRVLGLVAAVAVAVAVVILSQAEDVEPDDQREAAAIAEVPSTPVAEPEVLDAEPGIEDTEAAADAESSGTSADRASLPELPPFRLGLPPELSGSVLAAGSDGTLVTIDWDRLTKDEVSFPPAHRGQPVGALATRAPGGVVLHVGTTVLATFDSVIGQEASRIDALLPSDNGPVLLTDNGSRQRVSFSLPPGLAQAPGRSLTSRTLGSDLGVLGVFDGNVVAEKAGVVWLIDAAGEAVAVTDGRTVSFDGRHLVMLRCNAPDQCRIEVGPPDDPTRRSVPVPETLSDRSASAWTVAVSDDGRRLGVIVEDGPSLPVWIDLDTGSAAFNVASTANSAPLVWSPDGRFLLYTTIGNDLVVWDTETGQFRGVGLDRSIDQLVWTASPDGELLDDQS